MGEAHEVRGCCPLDCQDTCSWLARVEDGRVTAVRGDPGHPITRGTLCAKVNDYPLSRTYAPDRLLYPLRRTGFKGAGQFERISWEEALSEIAGRFGQILEQYGGEALLPHYFAGSMGVVQRLALRRLFHILGATRPKGSVCAQAGQVLAAQGVPLGFDPEDMVHSRLILLWGSNLLTTSHHGWHFVQEARRRGARVIAIDPRRTRTARQCDQHLAIRPGSDAVLARGIARVMVDEGLADLEFAGRAAPGLEDLLAELRRWPADRVAQVCGIAADDVTELGRMYGRMKPAAIRLGVSVGQTAGGEETVRAITALPILAGHWAETGGGLLLMTGPATVASRVSRPDLGPAVPEGPNPSPATPRSLDMSRLGQWLTDPGLPPPIKGLMVWCTNPAVIQSDANRVRQGLARQDLFTVVIEHVLTDTARFADIVLPSTTQLEHFDIVPSWGSHYVALNQPAIEPLGEALSHGEIMRRLARAMGLDHPALHESDEEIAAACLPAGMTLEDLKRTGYAKASPGRPVLDAGRIPVAGPTPEPLPAAAAGRPGAMLQLLTPKAHYFLNSTFADVPRHVRSEAGPALEMHPDDAAVRGLADGAQVLLRNSQGALPMRLRVTDRIRPGVVALPGKWWGESPVNLLAPPVWSTGGQPAYNDILVEVVPA